MTEVTSEALPAQTEAFGGGLKGAEFFSREVAKWLPSYRSPDRMINTVKMTADARGRDMVFNDGYALNGTNLHADSIVGAQYALNARPDWRFLGVPEEWAEEFSLEMESRFTLYAEGSFSKWIDAQRVNTFTEILRLGVITGVITGEITSSVEWIRESGRPYKTAIQSIVPDRLCNPNDGPDTEYLRRGIQRDRRGKPLLYNIREGYPYDFYIGETPYIWNPVPAYTPWGRKQFIHIYTQRLPDQSRGVAEMVSILQQMKMSKNFQEVTLQNAVINASYAAAIESELPDQVLQAAMGAGANGGDGLLGIIGQYLAGINRFLGGANNISIDGAVVPHLFPGSKLKMSPVGNPGGLGSNFEASLLRHIAAGLGLSYEELSRDYTKTSYSSARTSAATTQRFMTAKKKQTADAYANDIYALIGEEIWNAGDVPRPPGWSKSRLYQPLVKEAIFRASWIGASAGQIDELKETQAAIMRLASGLTTWEQECARLGYDWRDVYAQQARESKARDKLNLAFDLSAKRPLTSPGTPAPDSNTPDTAAEDEDVSGDNADTGESDND